MRSVAKNSRKDNRPSTLGGEGWISAFCRRLQTTHQQVLFESNQNSIYVARRLAVVLYQMGKLGTQSRDNEYATQHWSLCFRILDHCITSGMQFDPTMMQLYDQLRSIFQNKGDTQHENLH